MKATFHGAATANFALFFTEAATTLLTRVHAASTLRDLGLALKKRLGLERAAVALARKMAVVLHAMWKSETAFAPRLGSTVA